MEGEHYPILTFDSSLDLQMIIDFLRPSGDAHSLPSEHHEFEQWLDQQALPSPQSGFNPVPVENMDVEQNYDPNGEENLYGLLESVTFYPEAEKPEAEGQKVMELDQDISGHQDVPKPEGIPPSRDNVEAQEASKGACAVAVEQTNRQRKRKAVIVGERQQPKRECRERQSRNAAFEKEIKSATLQYRRHRSAISKDEHQ